MGKQIQIAQSAEDELELISWLSAKYDLLSLPRTLPDAEPVPVELGRLTDQKQIFFPRELSAYVLERVRRPKPATWRGETEDDINTYHVYPKAFACIEWDRSKFNGKTVRKGRYYLDTLEHEHSVSESQKKLITRLMDSLMSRIRRVSPYKVEYQLPIYVGSHLAERILAEDVEPVGDLVKGLTRNE